MQREQSMSEFDTTVDGRDVTEDEHKGNRETSKVTLEDMLRHFVLFISFGPGVLGFLWLIGRILRR